MMLQSLRALILAAQDALQTTCGLMVASEHVSQIRHGSLTFPAVAELQITGGTLQHVHVGCDSALCSHLDEMVDAVTQRSGIAVLVDRLLGQLVDEMSTRHPQGEVVRLEVGPKNVETRGIRSFGLRVATDAGNLYLMAEIPSKAEYEMARGSEFLLGLASNYLPRGWINRERLRNRADVENFLVFLRKVQSDIQIEVPAEEDSCYQHAGILLEQCTVDRRRVLKVATDLAEAGGVVPSPGQKITGRIGLADRSFVAELEYVGRSTHQVVGTAELACLFFEIPRELVIEQRRRAFRIDLADDVPVEIVQAADPLDIDPWALDTFESEPIVGQLADISFSGARIRGPRNSLCKSLDEGDQVVCRFNLPRRNQRIEVEGLVRRATSAMVDRNLWEDTVGIEFVVEPEGDRSAIDEIRDFVLNEQRIWLASRVHVSSVEQW